MKQQRKSLKVQIWEELESRGWVTPLSTPPPLFCDWWTNHDHCPKRIKGRDGAMGWTSGITAHKAWQCANYRDEFNERKNQHAAGTGVNYAYFGWHNSFPRPRKEGLSSIQLAHQQWCLRHNKPDPFARSPNAVPDKILQVRDFTEMKKVVAQLSEQMDMNKAICWTKKDSEAVNNP